jgi:hypothetical protein
MQGTSNMYSRLQFITSQPRHPASFNALLPKTLCYGARTLCNSSAHHSAEASGKRALKHDAKPRLDQQQRRLLKESAKELTHRISGGGTAPLLVRHARKPSLIPSTTKTAASHRSQDKL